MCVFEFVGVRCFVLVGVCVLVLGRCVRVGLCLCRCSCTSRCLSSCFCICVF